MWKVRNTTDRLSKKKIGASILIAVVVSTILFSWWYLGYRNIRIHVDLNEQNSRWLRDETTDLPVYASTMTYEVSNKGTATASDVQYLVYLDENLYFQDTISTLSSKEPYSDQFYIRTTYDSEQQITLTASCGDFSDSCSSTITATFPRSPFSDIMKLYITPNDSTIQDTAKEIQRNKFFLIPDWIAIRDWVGNNIEYERDIDVHDVGDFWQLPRETLHSRKGDCEDFSILLCSLYRAVGWDEDEVYVVVGEKDGNYHAWVKLNVDIIGWQNIEPQANGWSTFIGDFLTLSGYTAESNFNDIYSIDV